jgi:Zn-dependent protease with chaperone function
MLDDLKTRNILRPRMTLTKMIGFAAAGLIHSVTIILPLTGLWIILSRLGGNFSICYGLVFLGFGYVLRPRFVPYPKDALSRSQYPTLYEFVDSISNTLNAPMVDAIVVNDENNATLGTYGWRQAKILTIGYPMWAGLNEQSRVALIGHELAHQINYDATRGLFVGSALSSLIVWYHIFYPDAIIDRQSGFLGVPINLLFWIIANGFLAVYLGLLQIFLYEKRRAEYLADYIGASVGSTQGMIGVLKWLQGSMPARNMDTITTHPSQHFRIEFLDSKPKMIAQVILQPEYAKRIDSELLPLHKAFEERRHLIYKSGYR